MELIRTANAGVLLKIDGISVLLDGVSKELYPYLGTPDNIREELSSSFPDIVAFTHTHEDHYDGDYVSAYESKTHRTALGPEDLYPLEQNGIKIYRINTRHLGKAKVPHVSFVITGSKTVWFMGDATPASLKEMHDLPKPDVLIVPFAYGLTPSAWRDTLNTDAERIIFLHLPDVENDEFKLRETLQNTVDDMSCAVILKLAEKIII